MLIYFELNICPAGFEPTSAVLFSCYNHYRIYQEFPLIQGMHVVITISNNSDNYRDKETTDLANCPKIKYGNREWPHAI